MKPEDEHRIRKGIEKMLDKIAEGDLAAFQTIADRTDGKPTQALEHSGPDGEPIAVSVQSKDAAL